MTALFFEYLGVQGCAVFLSSSKSFYTCPTKNVVFVGLLGERATKDPVSYKKKFFRELLSLEPLLKSSKFFRAYCREYQSFTYALIHLQPTSKSVASIFFTIFDRAEWFDREPAICMLAKYLIKELRPEKLSKSERSMIQSNLCISASWGMNELIKLFVECGAQVKLMGRIASIQGQMAFDAMTMAAHMQRINPDKDPIPTMKLLKDLGASLNRCCNKQREVPLHWAAESGNLGMCEFLLREKANVNVKNPEGEFPLFKAVKGKHIKVVDLLLQQPSIQINAMTHQRCTALMQSCFMGLGSIVCLLLNNQADPKLKDDEGRSALHYLATSNADDEDVEETMDILLRNKEVEIDIRDNAGVTPLMLCAQYNPKMLPYFLDGGADLNAVDNDGNSVQHYVETT